MGLLLLAGAARTDAKWQYFRQYTNADGLSQAVAQAIYQDREGYLWVGTQAGLNRYDGESFTRFSIQDGLLNDWIQAVGEDPQGRIWVATLGGVSAWDGIRFVNYTTADGLVDPRVGALEIDSNGDVWCATPTGVSHYDGESWRTWTVEDGLPANQVNVFFRDRDGRLWAGTPGGLAFLRDQRFVAFESEGFTAQNVQALDQDEEGRLWVASDNRILVFEGPRVVKEHKVEDSPPGSNLRTLVVDRFGVAWAGTATGLARIESGVVSIYAEPQGLAYPDVRAIYEDREGNLWIGALGSLQKLQGRAFTNYGLDDGLASNLVRPILRDSTGSLWVGTEAGLGRLDDGGSWQRFTTKHGLPNASVKCLLEDQRGRLWIGTRGGLAYYEDGELTPESSFPQAYDVGALAKDRRGTLWVAAESAGLFRKVRQGFEAVRVAGQSFTRARLLVDGRGWVWASGDHGLSYWDGQRWHTFNTQDGLAADRPYFLAEGRAGKIWFGYHSSHGLSSFDGSEFRTFTTVDGLTSDAIYSLGVDEKNQLWVGTARGLNRFDGEIFHPYGVSDGYADEESNAGGFLADLDGTLWFGTMGGLSHYEPRFDMTQGAPPEVRFTSVSLSGMRVSLDEHPTVTHDQDDLQAHVAALSFTNEDQVHLQYRIPGRSEEWSDLEGRAITLFNLPPREAYALEARARKYRGPWSETARFHFTIKPPLWKTFWFWGVALGLGLAVLYGTYRLQTTNIRRRAAELEHKVNERTQELEHKTEELEAFIYTVSHDLKAPVISLQGLAGLLQGELGEKPGPDAELYLERIQANTIHMRRLIHDLLELSRIGKTEGERRTVSMDHLVNDVLEELQGQIQPKGATIRIPTPLPSVRCEPNRLRRVWTNLLTNALHYAREGVAPEIEIGSSNGHKKACFFVRDNGIGIPKEQRERVFEIFYRGHGKYDDSESTGVGLAIVQRIVASHGGKVWVESEGTDQGSTFWFTLSRRGEHGSR